MSKQSAARKHPLAKGPLLSLEGGSDWEIPRHCPKCGADIQKVGLEVWSWALVSQSISVNFGSGISTGDIDYGPAEDVDCESQAERIRCGCCNADLAGGDA
jgi:hypothetical protein